MHTTLITKSLLASTAILIQTANAAYQLVDDYSGDAFFSGFTFFTGPDPTAGHVQYQSLEQANASHLAGFISGTDGVKSVYLGVDTTSQAPEGRASVRVQSSKTYQHALVLADIAHMPGGVCGTWPAFWMVGANWPNDGEIDIVEGVNDQGSNQMTLHTNAGAIIDHEAHNDTFTGNLLTANCNVDAPDQSTNAGCSITDTDGLTFGKSFNDNGGGTFAMEWTSDFIKIWFIPRSDGSSSTNSTITKRESQLAQSFLSTSTPDTSVLFTPNSHFTGPFSMDAHFQNLQLVFDNTFCGAWAGAVWSQSACAALAPTCEQYVTENPQDFTDAFWSINSLRVFQDDGEDPSATSSVTQAPQTQTQEPVAPSTSAPWGVSPTQGKRDVGASRKRSGGSVLAMRS